MKKKFCKTDEFFQLLKKHFLYDDSDDIDETFLIQLRSNMNWDKDYFIELVRPMEICCEHYQSKDVVEKWVADGFWYTPQFVRDWSTHPNFPKPYEPEYYEKA